MGWKHYAIALLVFNALGALLVYALQRLQYWLPLNPQHFAAVSPDSSFNTAVSFVTNTNWQGYSGESTMSYLTQMAGLAVQNFLSAATGIVVAIALIRGLARHSAKAIGNFWVDVTRATLYVLLPMALVLALALVSQGVIQNFSAYKDVTMLRDAHLPAAEDRCRGQSAQGRRRQPGDGERHHADPDAADGPDRLPGGHQGARHQRRRLLQRQLRAPVREPDALSNFLEMLAIFLIPAALTYTFGRMVGDTRQGWAVLAAMVILFVALYAICSHSEQLGNPLIAAARRRSGREPRCSRAATWRARKRASASPPPRSSPRSPPAPPAAR